MNTSQKYFVVENKKPDQKN